VSVIPEVDTSAPQQSDSYLVEQCLQGNQDCFRELYQRYQQRVRYSLYRLCGASLLDDLVQEVFLRVWKGLPHLRQAAQFSTWLYRITWNVASDRRRQLGQQRCQEAKLIGDRAKLFPAPDLMHLHYLDLVQRGLQQIKLEHRAVLVLHDLEELPQKEVAQILGIPVGTVKSRLFHARAAMRQFLEAQEVEL